MFALPLAYAVTSPAVAPEFPPEFESTGKSLGKLEIQVVVGELVRSLTYGAVENVPIARNCPVSCKLSTVIELGMIVSESKGSGGEVSETEMLAVLDTTVPSVFVSCAVMVVEPTPTPVASPVELTVAMEGLLELHVIWEELVTLVSNPVVPDVPRAINCPVCPDADSDCEPGVMLTAVYFSVVPPDTVNVAVPVTTVPFAV
jgi:hypothetical protein